MVDAILLGFKDTLLDAVDVWKPALARTSGDRFSIARIMDRFGAEAVSPLIKALKDEEAQVRVGAAMALGKIGDARAVEPLIKALKREDWYANWNVPQSAADALKVIEPVEALIGVLSDDSRRRHASRILGEIGDRRAVEPLIGMLSNDDSWYAATALDGLGWVPETDGQRVAYLIALSDWESIVELGEPAVERLIKALEEDNFQLNLDAAMALGKIGDTRAVEPLINELGDKNWNLRKEAAEALGKIDDKRAVEPLIKALKDGHQYPAFLESIAGALGKIGDARAVEPLIKVLEESPSQSTHTSMRGVSTYSLPSWYHSIVEALGKIGDERAVEPLIKMLGNEDWGSSHPLERITPSTKRVYRERTRDAAKEALRKLGHEVE
jgi:HEAT repeat protein